VLFVCLYRVYQAKDSENCDIFVTSRDTVAWNKRLIRRILLGTRKKGTPKILRCLNDMTDWKKTDRERLLQATDSKTERSHSLAKP